MKKAGSEGGPLKSETVAAFHSSVGSVPGASAALANS
jgi:hypothetical protein